jgi:hypothetical protein
MTNTLSERMKGKKNSSKSSLIKAVMDDFALWMDELTAVLWSSSKKSPSWELVTNDKSLPDGTQQISIVFENYEKTIIQGRQHIAK